MDSRKDIFKERVSPYIKNRLEELSLTYGEDSYEYQSIYRQYYFDEREDEVGPETNDKHYDASVGYDNIERLYKHHGCVELNFSCAAHCRYCLRQNYEGFVLTDQQISDATEFWKKNNLDEILITGGDPFLSPKKLRLFIFKLVENCPALKIIRIATRTFGQNPELVNDEIIQVLSLAKQRIRIEIATQISSYVELTWYDTVNAFKKILDLGIPIYSQNVFLKGVNDDPEHLIKLYEYMRLVGITPHYLFASVPMKGTHHFRPSIKKMVDCYECLVNSGQVTGRSKPILALMTAIGKITLTPFNVIEYKEGEYISVKSKYKLEDRLAYNPNYKLPSEAWVDDDGFMCIKYLDGKD